MAESKWPNGRCPKTAHVTTPDGKHTGKYVRCQGDQGHDGEHTYDTSKAFGEPV